MGSERSPVLGPRGRIRLLWLVVGVSSVTAARAGYLIGTGYSSISAVADALSTPLGRLGYRMTIPRAATMHQLPAVADDLAAARKSTLENEGQMLALVVALHNLSGTGDAALAEAERICRRLEWSRCDRAALHQMTELVQQ
jgi:hypothetical protein